MKKILQGLLIGIANAIPGVSGATMAMLFGAYDDLILLLSKPYSLKIIKTQWALVLGMVIGTLFSVFVLTMLFSNIPLLMTCYFLGLITSGIIPQIKTIEDFRLSSLLFFIIGVLIIISIEMLASINIFVELPYYWLVIGALITSVAIILPGVSASLTLMALNLFFPLITYLHTLFNHLLKCELPTSEVILSIGLFTLAFGLGVMFSARLMKKMLDRYQKQTNVLSLGLIVASVGIVLAKLPITAHVINPYVEIVIGLVLGIASLIFIYLFLQKR